MAVSENVSGFQQLVMAEPADGAALLVGAEHAPAKAPLVHALADHRGHVLPSRGQRRRVVELPGGRRPDLVIDRHDKAQGSQCRSCGTRACCQRLPNNRRTGAWPAADSASTGRMWMKT